MRKNLPRSFPVAIFGHDKLQAGSEKKRNSTTECEEKQQSLMVAINPENPFPTVGGG